MASDYLQNSLFNLPLNIPATVFINMFVMSHLLYGSCLLGRSSCFQATSSNLSNTHCQNTTKHIATCYSPTRKHEAFLTAHLENKSTHKVLYDLTKFYHSRLCTFQGTFNSEWRHFWFSQFKGGCSWHLLWEVRDATKYPREHMMVFQHKELVGPKCQ